MKQLDDGQTASIVDHFPWFMMFVFSYFDICILFCNPCHSFSFNLFWDCCIRKYKVSVNMLFYFLPMIKQLDDWRSVSSANHLLWFMTFVFSAKNPIYQSTETKTFDVQLSKIPQLFRMFWSLEFQKHICPYTRSQGFNAESQNEESCVLEKFKNWKEIQLLRLECISEKNICSFKAEAERNCSVSLSGKSPRSSPQTGTIGNMGPSRGQRRAGAPMEINPRPFLFFLQKKKHLQQTKLIRRKF